jgi:hypothetical protein
VGSTGVLSNCRARYHARVGHQRQRDDRRGVDFALSKEFDVCSENLSRERMKVRAGGCRGFSEFCRSGCSYKTRALLQSRSHGRRKLNSCVLFSGASPTGGFSDETGPQ